MKRRQTRLVVLAVLTGLGIAIFLRDVVEQMIVRPAAYLLWWLGIFYRFIPQPVLWFLLVLFLLYLTWNGFAGNFKWPNWRNRKRVPLRGPVERLAAQIERQGGGIFFKWQIARSLGEIAAGLQELRQHVRVRQIDFDDDAAPADVVRYLNAGLYTSFSDYPLSRGVPLPERFRTAQKTPFDIELDPVIDYLASQMENDDDFRRP